VSDTASPVAEIFENRDRA